MCSRQRNNENGSSMTQKNVGETLQESCVTVTQEEWDSSSEIANDK